MCVCIKKSHLYITFVFILFIFYKCIEYLMNNLCIKNENTKYLIAYYISWRYIIIKEIFFFLFL